MSASLATGQSVTLDLGVVADAAAPDHSFKEQVVAFVWVTLLAVRSGAAHGETFLASLRKRFANRFGKNAVGFTKQVVAAITLVPAVVKRVCAKSFSHGPCVQVHRLAVKGVRDVGVAIVRLGVMIGPTTVGWLVIAVLVNPVDAEAIGTRPHVGLEVLETSPSGADLYATPAIVFERPKVWISAPRMHPEKQPVKRVPRNGIGFAWSGPVLGKLNAPAAARLDLVGVQIVRADYRRIPALANALPTNVGFASDRSQRSQSAEFLPGKVKHLAHKSLLVGDESITYHLRSS